MTGTPALQDVPTDAPVSPQASRLAVLLLDTTTSLDEGFALIADHFLALPRVELVAAALTTFPPIDEAGWTKLGQRAWVSEWVQTGSTCSVLPPPGAGPEAALTMPWISQRARESVLAIVDIDELPPEAAQDRREISGCGITSIVVGAQSSDGVMFGSLALGSSEVGPWPQSHVSDFRLINGALTSRIALEQARRSLAEAVAVGAQTRETHQHFFASIGHELRTPLTAIIGYTEMMVEAANERPADPFAATVSSDGEVILRAGEQLMAVLKDLLSAGRALGGADLREGVEVEAAVADVLHWHRTAARTGDVRLSSTVAPGQQVWAHPAGFRQVLANLVGNAVVHNTPQGSVDISSRSLIGESGEPRVRVIVRDTGPGLTTGQLAGVFEPFVRYAGPSVRGTGLGLSLSRSIAERDGGTIGAESTLGVGSVFWVELPLHGDAENGAGADAVK